MSRPTFKRRALSRAVLTAVAIGAIWAGCSRDQIETTSPRGSEIVLQDVLRPAMAVQERHSDRLLSIPGVVGTAVGLDRDGRAVIRVFTVRPGVAGLPDVLEGLPVESRVTGMFMAFSDPTTRFARPVPTGVSTGHPSVTAGTIAARVRDASGNVYALSNNHVYANQNAASIGDPGLQPGAYDGGVDPADRIGTLYDFQPINFSGGNNTIDAAIVLSSTSLLGNSTPADDGYGTPSSTTVTAYIGQPVQKYGRTTGLTHGEVSDLNATVNVCYEAILGILCIKQATFIGQIGITPGGFSAGGDSGSLIVTDDGNNHPVALLFAGSSSYTLANPIGAVLSRFNVTIDNSSPLPPDPVIDVAVSDVSAPASATQGDLASVDVRVSNVGNQPVTSPFSVTLTDETDGGLIGTQAIDGLAVGAFTVLSFEWNTDGASLGDHTLTASHDFGDDNSGNDFNSATVTVSEEPAGASGMHVGDLSPYVSSEGRTWSGYVIVRIHDQNHDPIMGATVYGTWTAGLAVDECTTDYAGECLMLSTLNGKKTKRLTFTVTDVAFGTATYSPSDNHDADGDSNGTSITINRP